MQSQRTAFVASPQAREYLMGRDGLPERPRTQRPTAGVAAARPQAYPAVGGGACPLAGIGAAPMGGARRRRDAAGRVGRGTQPGRLPSLRAGRGRLRARSGRIDAHDGHGAANSPPEAACGRHVVGGWATERLDAGGALRRPLQLGAGPRAARFRSLNRLRAARRDMPGGVPRAAAGHIFAQKPSSFAHSLESSISKL